MSEQLSEVLNFVILAGILVLLVRNFRKDKSEGRDALGGGKRIEPPSDQL